MSCTRKNLLINHHIYFRIFQKVKVIKFVYERNELTRVGEEEYRAERDGWIELGYGYAYSWTFIYAICIHYFPASHAFLAQKREEEKPQAVYI